MTPQSVLNRRLSVLLIALMVLPLEAFASTGGQAATTNPKGGLGEAPVANQSKQGDAIVSSPESTDPASPHEPAQTSTHSPAQAQIPVGTAAAPDTRVEGIAASTPSGAAIAPAKQRRVSKFAIRTALVIGTLVAVGVVAGASLASPSHP